jgi:hypothetical protein
MIDENDCGAIGGMKVGRGNRSSRRKPAPAPLCPPQIPHDHHLQVTSIATSSLDIGWEDIENTMINKKRISYCDALLKALRYGTRNPV